MAERHAWLLNDSR